MEQVYEFLKILGEELSPSVRYTIINKHKENKIRDNVNQSPTLNMISN